VRHSLARPDGRGHLNCWLLIGNSRWHWACQAPPGICKYVDENPAAGLARLQAWADQLLGWAAVGPVPPQAGLDPSRRLTLQDVPMVDLPPWLGVDRALVGWQAWRSAAAGSAVLVADAGTVLSLTCVDRRGRFVGGRLMAGAALQLRALNAGTANLPPPAGQLLLDPDPWPQATVAAMQSGVLRGLAAALNAAAEERILIPSGSDVSNTGKYVDKSAGKYADKCVDEYADKHVDEYVDKCVDEYVDKCVDEWSMWLTGGDGPLLAALLKASRRSWRLAPNLALDALASLTLASLRPDPGP
jgi:type III pantothenate kinase